MSAARSLFVSCGEVSGDVYAADFLRRLQEREPALAGRVWGMMGPRAEAACPDLGNWPHWSYEELQIMGLGEALRALPRILRLRHAMVRAVMEAQPEAVVLIDSPDYHLPLASALRRAGYGGRVVSLIPPTVWAWRSGRTKALRRDFDLCLPLFSFEDRFLSERGVRSLWRAHPLASELRGCCAPEELTRRIGGARAIALMPGSRRYDIKHHLDVLLGTAHILRDEGYLPVFSIAPGLAAPLADELRERTRGFETWDGEGRGLLVACRASVGVSGTVAVEAMALRRFMVVIYNVRPLTRVLLKALVRTPYISIPNCLTEAPVYPELLCGNAVPERIVKELRRYLEDPVLRAEVDGRLDRGREAMGTEDAADFWAECVIGLCAGRSGGLDG